MQPRPVIEEHMSLNVDNDMYAITKSHDEKRRQIIFVTCIQSAARKGFKRAREA